MKFSPEPGKPASLFQTTTIPCLYMSLWVHSHKKIILQIMPFDSCKPPSDLLAGFDL